MPSSCPIKLTASTLQASERMLVRQKAMQICSPTWGTHMGRCQLLDIASRKDMLGCEIGKLACVSLPQTWQSTIEVVLFKVPCNALQQNQRGACWKGGLKFAAAKTSHTAFDAQGLGCSMNLGGFRAARYCLNPRPSTATKQQVCIHTIFAAGHIVFMRTTQVVRTCGNDSLAKTSGNNSITPLQYSKSRMLLLLPMHKLLFEYMLHFTTQDYMYANTYI